MADKPLRVSPDELYATADALDMHAESFASAYRTAQAKAAGANLGSGLAAAALTEMLVATDAHAADAAARFAQHSRAHRDAARAYTATDEAGEQAITNSGR